MKRILSAVLLSMFLFTTACTNSTKAMHTPPEVTIPKDSPTITVTLPPTNVITKEPTNTIIQEPTNTITQAPTNTPTNTIAPTVQAESTVNQNIAPPKPTKKVEKTVYITKTGEKYHSSGCQYLSRSKIPISLSDAKSQGYTPCSKCNP